MPSARWGNLHVQTSTEPGLQNDGGNVCRPIDPLEVLMLKYQQADSAAVAELVRTVNPVLLRYFRGYTRNEAESEDLLQETWLRIHRSRHSYRAGSRALPWIFAIADHTRVDRYRKRSRELKREVAVDPLPEHRPRVEAPSSARWDLEALLAKLPEAQREVLLLLKFSELSIDEIAKLKGATAGAIKLRAHRAYEALRQMLRGGEGRA